MSSTCRRSIESQIRYGPYPLQLLFAPSFPPPSYRTIHSPDTLGPSPHQAAQDPECMDILLELGCLQLIDATHECLQFTHKHKIGTSPEATVSGNPAMFAEICKVVNGLEVGDPRLDQRVLEKVR